MTSTIPRYTCAKCAHTWLGRVEHEPRRCPNCKSATWQLPYKRKE